jgi:hypothetical protein
MDEGFLSLDEQKAMVVQVTDAMTNVVRPAVTSLSGDGTDRVRLWGTGTFISVDGMRLIITCRHVILDGGTDYGFFNAPEVFEAGNQIAVGEKLDAALINVPELIWERQRHETSMVAPAAFAKFDPVETEYFYLCGFAAENSHYGFDTLQGTPTAIVPKSIGMSRRNPISFTCIGSQARTLSRPVRMRRWQS